MRPLQIQILAPVVASSNQTSTMIDMRQIVCFSLQASGGAGALAGTIQIQVSDTPCKQTFLDYNLCNPVWTNLGSPLTFAQGSTASSQLIPKTDSSYVALQAVFTDSSSGSNTAKLTLNLAGLGM